MSIFNYIYLSISTGKGVGYLLTLIKKGVFKMSWLSKYKDGEIVNPAFGGMKPDEYYACGKESPYYKILTSSMYMSNFRHLINLLCSLFDYENCPIPTFEIEWRLMLQGFIPVYMHKVYGLVTSWGSLSGVSIYGHYTDFISTQPVLGTKRGKIGVDGEVIYNTPQDITDGESIVLNRLRYYAKMLTDLDVSMSVYTINSRAMSTPVARDDRSQTALTLYYDKLQEGEYTIPLCETGVLPTHSSLLENENRELFRPTEMQDLKERIIKQFAEEFGIPKTKDKAERMVVAEVLTQETFTNWNIWAMAKARYDGINKVNALYGTNIKCYLTKIDIADTILQHQNVQQGGIENGI